MASTLSLGTPTLGTIATPTYVTIPTGSTSGSSRLSFGVYIGIVVAAIAAASVWAGIVIYCCCKKRRRRLDLMSPDQAESQKSAFSGFRKRKVTADPYNPANGGSRDLDDREPNELEIHNPQPPELTGTQGGPEAIPMELYGSRARRSSSETREELPSSPVNALRELAANDVAAAELGLNTPRQSRNLAVLSSSAPRQHSKSERRGSNPQSFGIPSAGEEGKEPPSR